MSDLNKPNPFQAYFQLIYKNFKLLKTEGGKHYHYWYGDKKKVIQLFKGMSFPSIELLNQMGKVKDEKLLVLCASNENDVQFYGATILKLRSPQEGEMLSFVIHPDFRNIGYGQDLMNATFEMCRKLKISSIYVKYRTYWKTNSYWESLLDQTGWTGPELRLWYFILPDIKTQFHKDWVKNARLEEPFHVEEWQSDSLEQLKQALQQDKWQKIVPKSLSPFQMPELVLPHVSLLLKKEDQVAGWLICHLVQDDIVQATTLFVHPELAKGQGVNLMAEVVKRRKLGAQIIFMVEKHNTKMLKLAQKLFEGDSTKQHELRSRIKNL